MLPVAFSYPCSRMFLEISSHNFDFLYLGLENLSAFFFLRSSSSFMEARDHDTIPSSGTADVADVDADADADSSLASSMESKIKQFSDY